MGGSESSETLNKTAVTQTTVKIIIDRECQQAGAAIRGNVSLQLGEAQRSLFRNFDQGAVLVLVLEGVEKVFWAKGVDQTADRPKLKHEVAIHLRRDFARILVKEELEIARLTEANLNCPQLTIPFSVPLRADLPPSFFFCSKSMSCLSVQYSLSVTMIGLQSGYQAGSSISHHVAHNQVHLYLRDFEPYACEPVLAQV